jgi:hypothetical protein
MNAIATEAPALEARHFVRGKLVQGREVRVRSRDLGADFTTPAIDLDALITPRAEPPPLADIPLAEIIDFLAATAERLELWRNCYLQECLERVVATSPLPRRIIENMYAEAPCFLSKKNQDACLASRFIFVKGQGRQIEKFKQACPRRTS